MQALQFDGSTVQLVHTDAPTPGEGEALIRLRRAGICATDLEIVKGYMGFTGTLGHEFVGEVIECADASWVGRRVTGEINLGCGACSACQSGMSRHCPTRRVLGILNKDGCFADLLTLPVANLHSIPDAVTDEQAAFVEPLAAAFEILEQVHVGPNHSVAVLGDGRLGSLIMMVLAQTGASLTWVGRHRSKLALGEGYGAQVRLEHELTDPPKERFDIVVEAAGRSEGLARASALVRPRGTIVLKSTYEGSVQLSTAAWVIDEVTVVGSRCGPFAPAIRALAAGRVDPTPLLHASFPLDQGVQAMTRAAERGVTKVQLVGHD